MRFAYHIIAVLGRYICKYLYNYTVLHASMMWLRHKSLRPSLIGFGTPLRRSETAKVAEDEDEEASGGMASAGSCSDFA